MVTKKSESPKPTTQSKTCFVICPIGEDNSEKRDWSDTVFNDIIRPVVETEFYYKVFRAHEIPMPGTITRQIIENLIQADLVIADLSSNNPNVFYELAVRHATRKPYIQMINLKESIPFDTGAIRTIKFNTDIKYAKKAMVELRNQISAIESGKFKTDNPVGDAIDLMNMDKTGNNDKYEIATLSKTMSEIQSQLYSLTQNINIKLNRDSGLPRNATPYIDVFDFARRRTEKAQVLQFELNELESELKIVEQLGSTEDKHTYLKDRISAKKREIENMMRGSVDNGEFSARL